MKIGILSMQRIKNYGSFLQAYALKSFIEELGHDVEFIDFKIEKTIVEEKIKKRNLITRIKSKVRNTLTIINLGYYKNKLIQNNYNEYLKLLNISNEYIYNSKVDTLVIGSDEVFNCLQTNKDVGYSTELFGYNNNANRLISYAASCGTTTIGGLEQYKVKDEVSECLNKFNAISVRDNNSGEVVKNLTGKEPNFNLDPVFIYDFNGLIPNKVDINNYIVVYAYSNRIGYKEGKVIKEFAKKHKKKLVCIGSVQNCCDICIKANPFEMLAYIKNADYIITDTFHGSVFSIKFNKKFATIIRNSNKEKLSDLLNRVNLSNREVTDLNDLEAILTKEIDFKPVNEFLTKQITKAKEYLIENL